MTGNCICGAVQVTLQKVPDSMFDCNCSFCTRLGVLWGYFACTDAHIEGSTRTFTRPDRSEPSCLAHFCGTCGTTTHWSPTSSTPPDRMGVNMRLFDLALLDGMDVQFPDGRSWDGKSAFGFRRPAERIHPDRF